MTGGREFAWLKVPAAPPSPDAWQADGPVRLVLFAGDHGIADEVRNYGDTLLNTLDEVYLVKCHRNYDTAAGMGEALRGAGTIGRMARDLGAGLEVIDLGRSGEGGAVAGVKICTLGPGAANLARGPSMTDHQIARALAAGRHAAERARLGGARLFIGQGLGLGNALAATALACALLDPALRLRPGQALNCGSGQCLGCGSGLALSEVEGQAIRRGLDLHGGHLGSPYEALRRLGGFDLAALTGAFLACAHMGLPLQIDGYVGSVAALAATRLCPGSRDWMRFSQGSASGHFSTFLGEDQSRKSHWPISIFRSYNDNDHGARQATPDNENVASPQIVPPPQPSPVRGEGAIELRVFSQ